MKAADFRSVRGIYFDLDDTLCGYWDASKAGLRRALERHPVAGIDTESAVRAWAGAFREFAPTLKGNELYKKYLDSGDVTRKEQMRRTLASLGIEDDVHAQNLSDSYREERDRHLRLFPDALHVLGTLKGRYPMGLITNGPADIQREEIATLEIGNFFDHFFIEGELGYGKPLKQVFDGAASAMNLPPDRLLMVGNSFRHDIVPAIEDGWHTAWIRRESDVPPSADRQARGAVEPIPTSGPMPDAIIAQLTEILPMLGIDEKV